MCSSIRTAVIPAGGLGSRLMPLTRAVPKELLPVWKKPVLDYAVEEAAAAGIERVIIVTAPGKDSLQQHFLDKRQGAKKASSKQALAQLEVEFVIQETAKGLGDAIRIAAPRHEPVAVLLPDEFLMGENCLQQLIECHQAQAGTVLAVQHVPLADVKSYGIVDVVTTGTGLLEVKSLIEKPAPQDAPSQLAIIGRYILDPAVIDMLQNAEATLNGEIQLTDSIAATCGRSPVMAVPYNGQRFDCGSFRGLLQANIATAHAEDPALTVPPVPPVRPISRDTSVIRETAA